MKKFNLAPAEAASLLWTIVGPNGSACSSGDLDLHVEACPILRACAISGGSIGPLQAEFRRPVVEHLVKRVQAVQAWPGELAEAACSMKRKLVEYAELVKKVEDAKAEAGRKTKSA